MRTVRLTSDTNRRRGGILGVAIVAAVVAAVLACVMGLGIAVAETLTVTPNSGSETADGADLSGVSDYSTDIFVGKLDATSHDFLAGAYLQIIDTNSGEEIRGWETEDGLTEWNMVLNVDTNYTLHEVSAPDGYEVFDDIEFTIDAYDGEVTIVKGDGDVVSLVDKTTINVYDKRSATYKNQTETKTTSSTTTGSSTKNKSNLTQTGDIISMALIGLLAAAGIVAVCVAVITRRKDKQAAETAGTGSDAVNVGGADGADNVAKAEATGANGGAGGADGGASGDDAE